MESPRMGWNRGDLPQSNLRAALWSLWSEGKLTASLMRHLANMALLDGLQHPEVAKLASLGNFGLHANNCTRDFKRILFEEPPMSLPESIKVATVLWNPKDACRIPNGTLDVFDPAGLLHGLAFYHAFDEVLRTDLVGGLWENAHPEDTKLITLLAEKTDLTKRDLNRMVPLYIHGDDVDFVNGDSLMVWSMGSAVGSMSSLFSGLLFVELEGILFIWLRASWASAIWLMSHFSFFVFSFCCLCPLRELAFLYLIQTHIVGHVTALFVFYFFLRMQFSSRVRCGPYILLLFDSFILIGKKGLQAFVRR